MSARILIIEDNETNLELMVYLLRAFGYDPLVAHDGEDGVAMALRERPDLVVCDIQLPGIDGYAVLQRLKSADATQEIPVVAVTALAMVGDRDRILAAGFDAYISKPIEPERFVPEIESALQPGRRSDGPRVAPTASEYVETQTLPISAVSADILVVDDTPANVEFLRTLLESAGHHVRTACDVRSAHEMARTLRPDLVLSDLHMHPEAGTQLLKRFHDDPALRAVPVMILSLTSRHDQARDDCLARGARRFVALPLDPQLLLAEVADELRGLR